MGDVVRISDAQDSGWYWVRPTDNEQFKQDATNHEMRHVQDFQYVFDRLHHFTKQFTGECKTQSYFDCYQKVVEKYATAFKLAAVYMATVRHTSGIPPASYDPKANFGNDALDPYKKEQARSPELRRKAREALNEAIQAHIKCFGKVGGPPFWGGAADSFIDQILPH